MNLTVENLEKNMAKLTIEVDAAKVNDAIKKAYDKNKGKMSVPGFRKGKVPQAMIEKMYGPEVFYNDAIDAAFPEAYEKAIESEKLDTIGYPEVELVGDVTKDGFTFKATVAVYPDVKLGKYKGISAPKEEISPSFSGFSRITRHAAENIPNCTNFVRTEK